MQPIFPPVGNTAVFSLYPIGTKITLVLLVEVLPNRWQSSSNGAIFKLSQKMLFFSVYVQYITLTVLEILEIIFLSFE
jgi:hypothetical protein